MTKYITRGEFQKNLTTHFERYHTELSFFELMQYLDKNDLLSKGEAPAIPRHDVGDNLSDQDFYDLLNQFPIYLILPDDQDPARVIEENDIIPFGKDIFVLQHFQHIHNGIHAHNFIEVHYILNGSCKFIFEKEELILKEGELCIIAPYSRHDNAVIDDSIDITILIRKSTFNTTFFSLLSQENLLSHFFRTMLYDSAHSNYLLFFTKNSNALKSIIKNLTLENNKYDPYSNNCCISWINLLFAHILRNYSQTLQFYSYDFKSNFSLVLQYIQHNSASINLLELAKMFHYSEPYLSSMIKKNTGYNFSDLIRQLRLNNAMKYLLGSDLKIAEIAELVGYRSADHFSRTFRQVYQISPQQYKKEHGGDTVNHFHEYP